MASRGLNIARTTRFVSRLALVVAAGLVAGSCEERRGNVGSYRAYAPIPPETLAQMREKGTDAHKPILIRAFKKEAELEIWKMRADGEYVHFKTYPMCRWSGQLGPKRREGDRQVPEGFYTITPGQLNPNSAYYLSFNVGYPNAFDKAHGYTGGAIMVHGDCSSAGCFSMTDEQIAEIYAITREAFGGGQRAIQMQSLPFRMEAENLAKHRFDPNIRFWKQLKEGVDQFEVTKREPNVAICGKRYVFGATPADPTARFDANAECPALNVDTEVKSAVAVKQRHDETRVADLVSKGVKAVKVVYADGGQHPEFANKVTLLSRPEALAKPPVEIAINDKGKPVPAAVQVASAKSDFSKPDAARTARPTLAPVVATADVATATIPVAKTAPAVAAQATVAKAQPAQPAPANATAFAPTPAAAATTASAAPDQPFYKRLINIPGNLLKSDPPATPAAEAPAAATQPANATTATGKKQVQAPIAKPHASLATPRQTRPDVDGKTTIPTEMKAYAPIAR